ncbi:Dolichyl-diphosphooligosaccharide--protein glycosyltransferase subunit STT3B [Schistosoma japonicum]|uniref:dolichyl-diphosphooligosaccharide--protein glycotransferase n=1 Tax=Schistosoma japonicum TaxID=6182 RepID=A0A4Z2CUG1_SCHJA|nr:Dolichyl-diphosphooligosaccharide--protein glycosyltransferase subunit STT3B [Schistosoma japonicum]KAH8874288.1 Dolichyl-diphosphooligosaccharide--protein glycosyltransferase subunit STT3B [Schistosoma japonicum]TNN07782.1 Dolichyl-diphosphooligosaccharide--protein glycosyltransferase subunit STT3B [Schistosoma japonicum]TNN07783.1 Dolichyl-diphosphooligosaccharide--protein glycosyltransferase subunit STT3B [Schistosoma japonicum]
MHACGVDRFSSVSTRGRMGLVTFSILLLAWIVGFSIRLFSVIRFESVIHEFDPWFNYRATKQMVDNNFKSFYNWFDNTAWYPLGRIVGGTVYPGLMITSGFIHYICHLLSLPVHIREVCVFLAPIFSGMTAIATYFFTKEIWNEGAGLFAACFIAIAPGYISRSTAGSYDNEGIAIFALMFTYYLWIKAVKTGKVFWAAFCAISYFYMVSAWGGYVFIINLIPLHIFVLLIMQRYTAKLYVAYTTFFILGLIMSMQIPFVGFQPLRTSEHMASVGVFALLQVVAFFKYLQTRVPSDTLRQLFTFGAIFCAGVIFLSVVGLTYAGVIAPWSGRFYSLWDTGYAKIHIPIITSVSEHQPTSWASFFFDLHVLIATFPAGVRLCFKDLNDERVFVILYAIFASYFAGVMVRLMLTLTPIVCVFSAIAFSRVFELFLNEQDAEANSMANQHYNDGQNFPTDKRLYDKPNKTNKKLSSTDRDTSSTTSASPSSQQSSPGNNGNNLRAIAYILIIFILYLFVSHCVWVSSNAYSSPSIVLASYGKDGSRFILDDFREAYFWLWQNTKEDSRVMSWWDYGYQIAGMGNRTTLVDNNTWNNSHIALVGKAMASNESEAYKTIQSLDVDYVLVIFGGYIGYSGDDINKFLWMVRIGGGEHPNEIRERDFLTSTGDYRIDRSASQTMLNSLMYKLSYYRFGEVRFDMRTPPGFDRTRGSEIGRKNFELDYLEEAYTSRHWLVRIYRVLPPENLPHLSHTRRRIHRRPSGKSSSSRRGRLNIPSKRSSITFS